ncbi:universal stress protein [Frateuria terrea]|uniref:Universal stress protein family protein n=1 Tax=Frateuria terrea TaxID=529704 RepID=A0A1H6V3W8_9GAMM|nr:universal stress protein [Frateuria terrea]SEI94935.1 Universal stress protein family protein [Frateuria terrea]SFP33680.1 Universal stress protein family protein [Frateuria terrea]
MYEMIINVDHMREDVPAIQLGLAVARQQQAFAAGVHIVAQIPSVTAIPDALAILEAEEDSARQRAPWWDELSRRSNVQGSWEVYRGLYVTVLATRSRMADLLVCSAPGRQDLPIGWDNVTRTLFAGGAPMLLVPETYEVRGAPTRVLLAWNGSGESTEAIRAALPLLRSASEVRLLDGWRETLPGFGPPTLAVGEWLARQGVSVQQRHPFHPGEDAGAHLLREAETMRADLLVMGAWGRSRISELVLGGTTHHVLSHTHLPLLLAH